MSELHKPDRSLFFPPLTERSDAARLRLLIEGHVKLTKRYAEAYGGLAETLTAVREAKHPSLAQMSEAQRADLEASLVSARDQVARGFTRVLARTENDANELAPGTYPRDDEPFQSGDLGEWIDQILDALISILEGIADIFDAFGFGPGADAADAAAGGLRELDRYGEEQGWWDHDEDDDD